MHFASEIRTILQNAERKSWWVEWLSKPAVQGVDQDPESNGLESLPVENYGCAPQAMVALYPCGNDDTVSNCDGLRVFERLW